MKNFLYTLMAAVLLASCNQVPTTTATDAVQTVSELMLSRRSIRQYKDEPISREVLDEILNLGLNAPNGKNRQAYEIRVLGPTTIDAITAAVVNDNPQLAERPGFKNIFVNAPCVICIANDKSYDMSQIDCGLLGENIILAAWAHGIGSCCLGSSARWIKDSPSARPYLDQMNFSEGYELLYCIALGYPDETPDAKPRRDDMIMYME